MPNDTDDIEQIAPTPWAGREGDGFEDAQGMILGRCYGAMPEVVIRRDRIIACVNAHAKLVTACETALYILESTPRLPEDLAILRLRAALRQQEKNDASDQ